MRQYYGDPSEAFDRYDADQAEAERKIMRVCPTCQLCGEPIQDPYCYILTRADDFEERFRACIHTTCMKLYQIARTDRTDELIKQLIEEDCYGMTPMREEDTDG